MEASDEVRLALRSVPLPHLGQALGEVVAAFEARPLLGVVLVDASPIALVEGAHGHGARAAIMVQLGALVREVVQQLLGDGALVLAGETGRPEVMVLTFREGRDGGFYRDDLPNLVRALDHAIEKPGHRLVYPYAKRVPALGVGFAALVRNPFLGADTQIRSVVEEARDDAELKRKTLVRERRHDLMGRAARGSRELGLRADRGRRHQDRLRLRGARARSRRHRAPLARGAVRGGRGAPPRLRARLPVPPERPRRRGRAARKARTCS